MAPEAIVRAPPVAVGASDNTAAQPSASDGHVPTFRSTAAPLSPDLRSAMTGTSWHTGCPVGLDSLSVLTMTHWNMEGDIVQGQLIVATEVVVLVEAAFEVAFHERFPIARMVPIHSVGGDDDASMAADNTSAFNCRRVAGTSVWSEHSSGTAIDINPVENPWTRGDAVEPAAGREFLDRAVTRPGMLGPETGLVRVLREAGWGWGGEWASTRDYQHVSQSGR